MEHHKYHEVDNKNEAEQEIEDQTDHLEISDQTKINSCDNEGRYTDDDMDDDL